VSRELGPDSRLEEPSPDFGALAHEVLLHDVTLRERFDHWARSPSFRHVSPWLAAVQDRLLERIDWRQARRFLDVGCGVGRAVLLAARRLARAPGAIACGCDISPGMLARRTRSTSAGAPTMFSAAKARDLPFPDSTFDLLISTAAFHHFPEPLVALREFGRVLCPGGTLWIADTCRDQSLGAWAWDRLHRWFEAGHVQYYRRLQLRCLISDAGFVNIEATSLDLTYAETRKLVRGTVLFSAAAAA
jgi:ubiquinone/menaquinone biosynthesis C-methylase UbiE